MTSIAAIIPTYNRALPLRRAIESVLGQSRRPDEIIVVDDGSTDATDAVVAAYGDALTVIRKPNGGVSAARNTGVHASDAEFVAFLDSDDYWHGDHLARIDDAISLTAGAAGLYFSDLEFDSTRGGASAWTWAAFGPGRGCDVAEDADWAFLPRQPMTVQASVVRRDLYLAIGGCDEGLRCREDTHLFFKLALSEPMCAVAGCAGVLTGGDGPSLSVAFMPSHPRYLNATVFLYGDLLRRFADRMTRDQRRIAARRLADAHWALAARGGVRSPRRLAYHLRRVVQHDPAVVVRRLVRRARVTVRDLHDFERFG